MKLSLFAVIALANLVENAQAQWSPYGKWFKGKVGNYNDRSLGELFREPYMSQGGIDECVNRAAGRGFDGFYAYSQSGTMACIFFVRENMKGGDVLKTWEEVPSSDVIGYSRNDISYIMPQADGAGAYGEPHFATWSNEKYDFQGGCDLVLLQNENFADGLGMNIHIRTSVRKWWSFIESAVIQIGQDTLEVKGSENDGATVWINHSWEMDLQTGDFALGDYPVHLKRVNDHHTIARIDIGNGDAISIETFKTFVRVNAHNKSNKAFGGSLGLMGDFPSGHKIGRDGETLFDDADEFGLEWQRLASEPNLFHTLVGAVEPPNQCEMPAKKSESDMRRRLAGGGISQEDAELACARVNKEHDRDACIFDVMATQDKAMAGSY